MHRSHVNKRRRSCDVPPLVPPPRAVRVLTIHALTTCTATHARIHGEERWKIHPKKDQQATDSPFHQAGGCR